MKIGFDIGGVMSRYPDTFREIAAAFALAGHELFVITDMPDADQARALVRANGFDRFIRLDHVRSADYSAHGEMCKAELVRALGLDLMFDDYGPYLAGMVDSGCVGLMVWPNPKAPYDSPSWRRSAAELPCPACKHSRDDHTIYGGRLILCGDCGTREERCSVTREEFIPA